MKRFISTLTLFSSAFALATIPTAQQAKDATNYVPNAYIIEFANLGALSKQTLVSVYFIPCIGGTDLFIIIY
jgi:hypothetical protein